MTNNTPINNSGAGTVTGLSLVGPTCIVNNAPVAVTGTGGAEALLITGDGTITTSANTTATVNGNGIAQAAAINGNGSVSNSATATAIVTGAGIAEALRVNGTGSISNSGTAIATVGTGIAEAISVNGPGSVTNSGTVTATGTSGIASGISINGNGNLTNSGTVSVRSATGDANGLSVGIGSLVNTGSVTTSAGGGGFSTGISFGGGGPLTNTGSVQALGSNNIAIATGSNTTIVNSGLVSAPGGAAFTLGDTNTLTLLPGSHLEGAINLGAGNAVNVDVANQNLTFNTLSGQTVTSNLPFAVVGNQVVTVDPTPFGLADKNLMDFTRGVSSILGTLGGVAPGPNGAVASAFAPNESITGRVDDAFASIAGISALAYAGDGTMAFKAPTVVDQFGRSIWVRGFGGEHVQDADGVLLRSTNVFMGGAVGFDFVARPDLRLGVFAGGGGSQFVTAANMSRVDTDTTFGGIYGRWGFASFGAASFLDFALHGGGSHNSSSRTVNNNLAAGGTEIATAGYNSWYISPELAYGVNLPLWAEYTLTPSLRVRYVGGSFGGYTETGSTANLTVGSRTISDFEERGELKLTRATPVGRDLLLTSIYVGGIGIERTADETVNTVVLGTGLPFVTPGRSTVGGVLGGGGLEWRTREGWSFFGAAEAIGFTDSSTVVSGRGGLRVAF